MANGEADISFCKVDIANEKIKGEWVQPQFCGSEEWGANGGALLFHQKMDVDTSRIYDTALNKEIISSLEAIENKVGAIVIELPSHKLEEGTTIKNKRGITIIDTEIPLQELKNYDLNLKRLAWSPQGFNIEHLLYFKTKDDKGKVAICGTIYESFKESKRKEISGFRTWLTGKKSYVAIHNILGLSAKLSGSIEGVEAYNKAISDGLKDIGYS